LIECIGNVSRAAPRPPARAVMFDFDGTVGLVRAGWMPVMLDMMMETLGPLGTDPSALRTEAEQYVARLTGKDTVHQMEAFADHVRSLGGAPLSAVRYKAMFVERMDLGMWERLTAVKEGRAPADSLLLPGTRRLLEALRDRGLRVYLASGTAHDEICRDAALLGIDHLFDDIHGSAPGRLSKRGLLESIVESGIAADEIVTFGDGRVEIEETKAVGGAAVGVASSEPRCMEIDVKKRGWLIAAGADYIIPNYLDPAVLDIVAGQL